MFNTSNEFSIHIEHLKEQQNFDTIIETLVWFTENESDQEYEQIVKLLNRRLKQQVEIEARDLKLLKDNSELVSLFS
jgi:wyosine [tRNA(Phe)-imidazoG37] synthetase (radical SAM superfamily)